MKQIDFDNIQIDLHYITEMHCQLIEEFDIDQEFEIFQEEDTSASNNSNNNSGMPDMSVKTSDAETVEKKAGNVDFGKKMSLMLQRFRTWLANMSQKAVEVFGKNFSAQIGYVEKNQELNKEIEGSLNDGKFKPTVQNWPLYKIPVKDIVEYANHMPDKLKLYYDKNNFKNYEEPDIDKLRAVVYPPECSSKEASTPTQVHQNSYIPTRDIHDYWTMEATEGQAEGKQSDPKAEEYKKKLQSYFLFNKVTDKGLNDPSNYTNELTGDIWKDTCDNIAGCRKALEEGIKAVSKSLEKCTGEIQKAVEATEKEIQSLESEKENQDADKLSYDKDYLKRCQDMAKNLATIGNEYAVGFANTMQDLFFKKCYNLYKDIVTEYKNTRGAYNQQQPNANTQAQNVNNANNNTAAKPVATPAAQTGATQAATPAATGAPAVAGG